MKNSNYNDCLRATDETGSKTAEERIFETERENLEKAIAKKDSVTLRGIIREGLSQETIDRAYKALDGIAEEKLEKAIAEKNIEEIERIYQDALSVLSVEIRKKALKAIVDLTSREPNQKITNQTT